jgi:hypothetical protein
MSIILLTSIPKLSTIIFFISQVPSLCELLTCWCLCSQASCGMSSDGPVLLCLAAIGRCGGPHVLPSVAVQVPVHISSCSLPWAVNVMLKQELPQQLMFPSLAVHVIPKQEPLEKLIRITMDMNMRCLFNICGVFP